MQNPDVLRQKIQDCLASENLSQATKHLQKLCKIEPDDFQAWYFLGSIQGQLGKLNDAIKSLQHAIRINPSSIDALSILGLAFFSVNRYPEAITTYEKLIAIEANNLDALINIGAAYILLKKYQQAIAPLQQSLQYEVTSTAHANLGKALHHMGDDQQALKHLHEALKTEPSSLDALMIMADIQHVQRNFEDALYYYDKTIEFHSDIEKAWNNKGLVLYDMHETQEAIKCFRQAIKLNPKYLSAYINLGIAEHDMGQSFEAEKLLNKALKISPKNEKLLNELGRICLSQAEHSKAMKCFKQAYQYSDANSASKHVSISNFLYAMNYDPQYSQKDIYDAHKKWGDSLTKQNNSDFPVCDNPNKKIRIGYLSPDFRSHSVAYFIEPLLANHNKDDFEIFCYANVSAPDKKTDELLAYADQSRDIHHLGTDELHETIVNDKIDILVDLAGHTSGNSLFNFAKKPAPIQINYLGYPNTTGLSTVDYRIVDKITDPEDHDLWHTEQLIYMPACFLCYKPPFDAPAIKPNPSLDNKTITFGCFNSIVKFTPELISAFSDILKFTNNAKLVLKGKSLNDDDIRQTLLKQFSANGVREANLLLLSQTSTNKEHLDLYNTVDIALDTFPYNGTTTTCEALYMGTPVISFLGERHAARVSASLLNTIGHPELVADSKQDYVKLAIELGNDSTRLEGYNKKLRKDMLDSPLCDAVTFTINMEDIYKNIWLKHCNTIS